MSFVNGIFEPNLSIVKKFGIAELERLSGIKAHTIRTWEQRYGILNPVRAKNNLRKYSIEALNHLLCIALLNRKGFKISKLYSLSHDELIHQLRNLSDLGSQHQIAINQLLFSMYSRNSVGFEQELNKCFLNWSALVVIESIINPFLNLTNLLFEGNQLVEEHLVVTILRQKLLYAIEELIVPMRNDRTVLLFMHEPYQLDLSMLSLFFCLKQKGVKVIYMGNNVSLENLSSMLDTEKPGYIYTYLTLRKKFQIGKLLNLLTEKLPNGKLLITPHPDSSQDFNNLANVLIVDFEKAVNIICKD